ncbi:RDD family protein [Streptomyces sp. NPDC002932]|uniref:RDD family protein n=1 Tax=Streptomyces sp. NPDC002932 TaxID=3364672 RepID=UPI0036CB0ED2
MASILSHVDQVEVTCGSLGSSFASLVGHFDSASGGVVSASTPNLRAPDGSGPLAKPSAWRRFLAWFIDFAIVLAVAVLLGILTFDRISNRLTSVGAAGDVWQVLRAGGHRSETAFAVASSTWETIVIYIAEGFAALVLFAFLYEFLALLWTRRTAGKAILGLRVVPNGSRIDDPLGWRRSATRALLTTTTNVGCYAVACCVLIGGEFVLAMLCWAVAVAAFCLNAWSTRLGVGRSVADRLAGTAVTTVQWSQAVGYATDRGQAVWRGSRQAAQQLAEHERLRQIAQSDHARRTADLGRAAVRGGRSAWEGARQGAEAGTQRATDRAHRMAESELGRAAADKGRAYLGRARSAVGRRRNQTEQRPLTPPRLPDSFGLPPYPGPPSQPPPEGPVPPFPPSEQ